ALFPSFGLGISTLSLMGFLLSLGVLVDDAIVIGERIYTREQLTNNPRSAAVMGTSEVAVPVFFGVLTTMAAFIPVVSVDSMLGQFFGAIGWTVILCLLFSLIESQLILPAHLAHRRRSRGKTKIGARWEAFQDRVVKSLENFATGRYKRWLILGLQYRHITLSIALAIMVVMGGMLASGRVLFQFFPSVAGDLLIARLVLPEGYPIEETKTLVAEIQAAAATLDQEMTEASPDGESAIVSELVSVGMPLSVGSLGNTGQTGSHIAEIGLNLKPHRERQGMTPTEAAARWRALTPALPDVVEQSFTAAAVSLGPDINLELRGRDIEVLGQAAHEISEILGSFDGIFDITDSYRAGKQEYTIKVRPEAESLGLTQADLGNQVRHAFYGSEAQRVQRGRDDVRIMVRYPRAERTSLSAFENMFVRLPDDTEVPLLAVASIAMSEGNATIQRTDGQRTISVTAYANRSVVAPESILAQMEREHLTDFQNRYPNVSLVLAGEAEERASALDGLARTSVLALIVIYSLLAVPLKSYTQPLVVMTSIPFGFIGAVVGHYLMGYDLVFFSLLGMVALSGVVINSSLVLVDFINRNKRTPNMSVFDAVVLAGTERFRPIFLTSVTTFVGLIPLMFNADLDTAPFVPLAVSLGFGVIFATTVTLILIPTLYLLLEDIHTALGIKTHKELPQESPY
ncbi:MAG: efflux RND transporter permease subunit, partial [Proteobacteria bacterium]|nr:efflux RND transporter permease subunit [Pseudomonadota bacterium]